MMGADAPILPMKMLAAEVEDSLMGFGATSAMRKSDIFTEF